MVTKVNQDMLDLAYNTVAAMVAAAPTIGVLVNTKGYYAAGDGGGASYLITAGNTGDGFGNHNIGTNTATLQKGIATYVEQWGFVADGGVDNADAFETMMVTLPKIGVPWYVSVGDIHFGTGTYYFSRNWDLKVQGNFLGQGQGLAGGYGTTLEFTGDDFAAIAVNRYNTKDNVIEPKPTSAADGTIIDGFYIKARNKNFIQSYDNYLGIRLRARAVIANCVISGFGGIGVAVIANGGADFTEGNANSFELREIRVQRCGTGGIYIRGADANSGIIFNVDASSNDGFGILEDSFLGNTHTGNHTASNGAFGRVSHGDDGAGNHYIYFCRDWTQASTVVPGTDENVWTYAYTHTNTGYYPPWVSGTLYLDAHSTTSIGLSSHNVFIGLYSEGDQMPHIFSQRDSVIGGTLGAGINWRHTSGAFIEEYGSMRGLVVSKTSAEDSSVNQYVSIGSQSGSLSNKPVTKRTRWRDYDWSPTADVNCWEGFSTFNPTSTERKYQLYGTMAASNGHVNAGVVIGGDQRQQVRSGSFMVSGSDLHVGGTNGRKLSNDISRYTYYTQGDLQFQNPSAAGTNAISVCIGSGLGDGTAQFAYIKTTPPFKGVVEQSPDGTYYKLSPPNGGGQGIWTSITPEELLQLRGGN